jgi:ficolin
LLQHTRYSACHSSNLNGKYLNGDHSSYANGMNWYAWKGHHHSMSQTKVMLM